MAMSVNPLLNVKDSRWLQLEVCREFQRNKCTRSDSECKFAHPASNVEIQNGRVIACYDSIKGRCNREKPPCKYFHPPKHLKDQLIINGKNHLALKNALLQQVPFPTVLAGQMPMVGPFANLLNLYPRPPPLVNPPPPSNPYPMAAYASALNGQQQHSFLLNSNSSLKTSSPYLPALAAAAAAASSAAAFGNFQNSAAAAMLLSQEQYQPAPPPQSYGMPVATSSAQSAVNTYNMSNKSRMNVEANANLTNTNNVGSIESHVLAEASNLNAVSTAASVAAAASATSNGRKRAREADDLLSQISGTYPVIAKRPALDKNGAPLYHGATAAYPQPFTMHQPFVPLSFYFPLVGQGNSLPRY